MWYKKLNQKKAFHKDLKLMHHHHLDSNELQKIKDFQV